MTAFKIKLICVDSDNDGIQDKIDLCITEPEVYNGYRDIDGCPDNNVEQLDSDSDGVPDIMDLCPDEKETYNKYNDYDGCPDSILSFDGTLNDADGDKIMDADDACRLDPERYNGFQDDDGCPDIPPYSSDNDSDLDGIPNSLDQCPDVKETYNRFQDDDGCPDFVGSDKGVIKEFQILIMTELMIFRIHVQTNQKLLTVFWIETAVQMPILLHLIGIETAYLTILTHVR
jgi:hypothetical protein